MKMTIPTGNVSSVRFDDENFGSLGPYQVSMETTSGEVKIDLYNHLAPVTVENFVNLANAGYYDGLEFHTVDVGSAVFGGSKIDAFGGTAGYYIPSEFHPNALHDAAGTVSMVSKVVDGGSSEFVIALEPKPEWDAYLDGEVKDCADPEEICYAVFRPSCRRVGRLDELRADRRVVHGRRPSSHLIRDHRGTYPRMKYRSAITHLECTLTGERFDASHPHRTNPTNGKPLFARYDLDKAKTTLTKSSLPDRRKDMWRYREVMPVLEDANIIALGEGGTPLLEADRLANEIGLSSVYVKDEGVNPTGSFKARGLGAAVSKAKELGLTRLTMPSAGNAAGAMSAYAAAGGMEAHVFMPKDAPIAKQDRVPSVRRQTPR